MTTTKHALLLAPALALVPVLILAAASRPEPLTVGDPAITFKYSTIYWEYNDTANDLGVHVKLDGEDWRTLGIEDPRGRTIFQVRGQGPYRALGMTELFFEGAEPSLAQYPLQELLAQFPAGTYEFSGLTVDGEEMEGTHSFSHAIPDGPVVSATVGANGYLSIQWSPVTGPPPGFPNVPVKVVAYQVIVEPSYQVTLPATATSVTVSPEFVLTLPTGVNKFEVLAIEASGNQTLTEGTFTL